MGVDLSGIPLSARRAIEAQFALRLYTVALPTLGPDAALRVLNAAIDAAAREAGQAFAARAPRSTPSLEHFSQVLDIWQEGDALTITDLERGPNFLNFSVSRCGYMEMYRCMDLPMVLHATLSCRRDAAFAEGYSPHLRLDRPETISSGAARCLFRFRWQE